MVVSLDDVSLVITVAFILILVESAEISDVTFSSIDKKTEDFTRWTEGGYSGTLCFTNRDGISWSAHGKVIELTIGISLIIDIPDIIFRTSSHRLEV